MEAQIRTARPRGRPRSAAPEEILEGAMRVFWAEGYEAASIDLLCRAACIPRASLYQDFGGKEGLFLASIAHYVETRISPIGQALGPSDSIETDLAAFFHEVIALATHDDRMLGCLISCVLADAAGSKANFRQELSVRFAALEEKITLRLKHGITCENQTDLRAIAGMLAAVARGIMLRARSGAKAQDLERIADVAVRSVIKELT